MEKVTLMIWLKNTSGRGAANIKDVRRDASQGSLQRIGPESGRDVVAIYRSRKTWEE